MTEKLTDQTIDDFGAQWTRYTNNDGYYGSTELLDDIFAPLLPALELNGLRVAEIGSGTGRIVLMLLNADVAHVTAVEPSAAFEILKENTHEHSDRISYVKARGEDLPTNPPLDLVCSIGVLHHIPDPDPAVQAAYRALKPGGKMLVWLYGWEGNKIYLSIVQPLRKITSRLPHFLLAPLCHLLNGLLTAYIAASRMMPLPLHRYMTEVIGKFSMQKRFLVIYDQLKPAYAKYYRQHEARDLLERAGFTDVSLHHRHGYSWTVLGVKPTTSEHHAERDDHV